MEAITVLIIKLDGELDFEKSANFAYSVDDEIDYQSKLCQAEQYFCDVCKINVDESDDILAEGHHTLENGDKVLLFTLQSF